MTEIPSLKTLWRDGGTTLGGWLSLREPLLAEAARPTRATTTCASTCSTAWPTTSRRRHACCTPWPARPTVPIVRVPWNEQGIIGRVLDAGAMGVIIPMVNSAGGGAPRPSPPAATRRRAPAASGRSSAGARYGGGYFGSADDAGGVHPDDRDPPGGRGHRRHPRRATGIDAVYIGPADLSITYGLPPGVDNPGEPFDGALATVVGGVPAPRRRARHPLGRRAGGQAPRRAGSA